MFQVPRGTRDFTPNEMQKRRYLEQNMATTFTSFGYGEIQTPTFENLELFTAKSGESIINELYTFTDKGGRELALRPELTAPVIRFYVERLQMEPKPLKLFYFGNCYRYDRPQKGRYREFQQAGCEIIGADTFEATAELLALAFTLLKNTGLKNVRINLGNLTIISAMFKKLKLLKDDQKTLLPLIDKSLFDDLKIALGECNVSEKEIDSFISVLQSSDIGEIRSFIADDHDAMKELHSMEAILDLLKNAFHVNEFEIKLSIVRGLDYYKGLVFEIDAPVLGAEKQLCGGGSYELVSLFGGTVVPTAGFAVGFDRTILALEAEGFIFPPSKLDVFIIPVNQDMVSTSIEIAQQLRNHNISVDFDQLRRGMGKSLKYADAKHVDKVIIVGPKELEKKTVILRDMKTGNQETVAITEIYGKLKKT
ncbi:MAG TPA: histidine--tRNA ligase [Thermoplasmata archaeon]|jgi:histidyl-tRNA synthetase|nr:MAG TPA: histidine--tRNA ligase [Thermoplasmata archaeon]